MITIIYTMHAGNKTAVASTKVRTVSDAADTLYMVLTAHYGNVDKARADANSLERAFKNRKRRRFDLIDVGKFAFAVTR